MPMWSLNSDVKMGWWGWVSICIPENEGHAPALCDNLILAPTMLQLTNKSRL
jgi:hypothetical protein